MSSLLQCWKKRQESTWLHCTLACGPWESPVILWTWMMSGPFCSGDTRFLVNCCGSSKPWIEAQGDCACLLQGILAVLDHERYQQGNELASTLLNPLFDVVISMALAQHQHFGPKVRFDLESELEYEESGKDEWRAILARPWVHKWPAWPLLVIEWIYLSIWCEHWKSAVDGANHQFKEDQDPCSSPMWLAISWSAAKKCFVKAGWWPSLCCRRGVWVSIKIAVLTRRSTRPSTRHLAALEACAELYAIREDSRWGPTQAVQVYHLLYLTVT